MGFFTGFLGYRVLGFWGLEVYGLFTCFDKGLAGLSLGTRHRLDPPP